MAGSSKFHLSVEGLKLPADVEARVSSELRATLLRELGRTDLPTGEAHVVRIPKEWLGMVVQKLKAGTALPDMPKGFTAEMP